MTCSKAKGNAKFIPVNFTKQAEGADLQFDLFLNFSILLALAALSPRG
jgi:hypothetical protein